LLDITGGVRCQRLLALLQGLSEGTVGALASSEVEDVAVLEPNAQLGILRRNLILRHTSDRRGDLPERPGIVPLVRIGSPFAPGNTCGFGSRRRRTACPPRGRRGPSRASSGTDPFDPRPAVAKLPPDQEKIVMFGKVMWPPVGNVYYDYDQVRAAAWMVHQADEWLRLSKMGENAGSRAIQIRPLVYWPKTLMQKGCEPDQSRLY
jgi:hypothetical protein